MTEHRYDAFISYHSADLPWVRDELLPRLEGAGLKVIVDYRDFAVGVARLVNIERAVEDSRHTLIVLTPEWVGSEWTAFESLLVSTADPAGRQRKLIPLMLKPSRLPQRIAMLTCADFTQAWPWEQLIATLKGVKELPGEDEREPAAGGGSEASTGEFVDREEELLLLRPERLRAGRSSYTLISAPAGYGKSCLLRRLIAVSRSEEAVRREWCFCHVDFGAWSGDPIDGILRALGAQTSPEGGDRSIDSVCRFIVQTLAAPLADGRRAVLLIFDTVEQLDQGGRQWLYALLHELYQRTRPGPQEIITVRVVLAGRNAERFWEGYERAFPPLPPPQRIHLRPFDQRAIQELIWTRAETAQIALDDQTVVHMADHVRHLSGGHPEAACSLVDDLADQSFAIGPVAEYFERCREGLVRTVLSPVADDLLESLEPHIREAVRTLSVFRRVNANTVQALIRAGALPANTHEIDLLGELRGAHLLDGPTLREPFYRDRWMRHVLALDMAYRSPESQARYRRLNGMALDLYVGWIQNLGSALPDSQLKSMQRLLSVVEWLYHALQKPVPEADALCAELRAHVSALPDGDQEPPVGELLAGEIGQDAEVCYLLRYRLGEEGVSTVMGGLERGS